MKGLFIHVVIREIGISKGIIIPATALKEAGIDKIADMCVENGCIIVETINHPRANWVEAIQADPPEDH